MNALVWFEGKERPVRETTAIAERLKRLLGVIDETGFATIKDLAKVCDVSEITARRDVKGLAERGKLRLVHGGVISVNGSGDHGPGHPELQVNREKKRAVAAMAAAMIQPNDILFLDSGTTVQELARTLPRSIRLTVVCCSLDTFESCRNYENCEIILVGGMFSPNSTLFYGHESVEMLKKFRTRRAFFGATGCDVKLGVTCRYVNDVQLKQVALATSIESVLLVDSDKFGKVGSHFFSEPTAFSSIITDWGLPEAERAAFADVGCDILVAGPRPAEPQLQQ